MFDDSRGVSCNDAIGRHIMQNNGVASDDYIVSYMDIAEDTSSCTDHHIITNDWGFPLTYAIRPFGSDRNMLEYRAFWADFCFGVHHTSKASMVKICSSSKFRFCTDRIAKNKML